MKSFLYLLTALLLSCTIHAQSNGYSNLCLTQTTKEDFNCGTLNNVQVFPSGDVWVLPSGDISLANGSIVGGPGDSQNYYGSGGININSTQSVAQTFISSGELLSFSIRVVGNSGSCDCQLYNTSGGVPSTPIPNTFATFQFDSTGIISTNFIPHPCLISGVTYAIVCSSYSTSSGTWSTACGSAVGCNPYAGGTAFYSNDNGLTWNDSGTDCVFATQVGVINYTAPGDFISATIDAGQPTTWNSISWNADVSGNAKVKFQVAASNDPAGPFTFTGPDCTTSTYYTVSGTRLDSLPVPFSCTSGYRYLKYKAFLSPNTSTPSSCYPWSSPLVHDVTVCFQQAPICHPTSSLILHAFDPGCDVFQWQVSTDHGLTFSNLANGGIYSGVLTSGLHISNPTCDLYGYEFKCTNSLYIITFANTWLGVANSAWENPANWSCGVAPDVCTDVYINAGATVVINSNVTIATLHLDPSSSLTVNPPYTLTLVGH